MAESRPRNRRTRLDLLALAQRARALDADCPCYIGPGHPLWLKAKLKRARADARFQALLAKLAAQ
jgi:hypothetical protein